jgi:hypothetical protein
MALAYLQGSAVGEVLLCTVELWTVGLSPVLQAAELCACEGAV